MGIVYKVQDTVLDRLVAFKVLPQALTENPQAITNFMREAQAAAKLNHPNIVTVYDTGEQAGRYYIAMEYVEGTTLKEILRRRGAISPSGILHVLMQISEALAYAHEKKVVHRDIKPANAMWTRDKKAKLMDFGLAKVVVGDYRLDDVAAIEEFRSHRAGQQSGLNRWGAVLVVDLDHEIGDRRFAQLTEPIPEQDVVGLREPLTGLVVAIPAGCLVAEKLVAAIDRPRIEHHDRVRVGHRHRSWFKLDGAAESNEDPDHLRLIRVERLDRAPDLVEVDIEPEVGGGE